MNGQLLEYERAFLFWTIIAVKPASVLEIGTWKGGGSTYQIASALKMNRSGHLYTCEKDSDLYNEAVLAYLANPLKTCISFFNMESGEFLRQMSKHVRPDFVFFDGGEDPQEALDDFQYIEQYMFPGAMFMAHDWDLGERMDGGVSHKNDLLRPYIENAPQWKIKKVITKPYSVGMVLAEKVVV